VGTINKGAVDEPKENSTFYATTKIWSEEAGRKISG
jgi:hypothetical protein